MVLSKRKKENIVLLVRKRDAVTIKLGRNLSLDYHIDEINKFWISFYIKNYIRPAVGKSFNTFQNL